MHRIKVHLALILPLLASEPDSLRWILVRTHLFAVVFVLSCAGGERLKATCAESGGPKQDRRFLRLFSVGAVVGFFPARRWRSGLGGGDGRRPIERKSRK